MIDIHSLPLIPKLVLFTGFSIGIVSFALFLRYPIMLVLMKYSPEYRKFIKRIIERKNKNNFQ